MITGIRIYRKKQVKIEAIIFDGENLKECREYIGENNYDHTLNYPNIITSEGTMRVNKGDYIIKEPFDKERGFYPCKPDIFALTYDISEEQNTEIAFAEWIRTFEALEKKDGFWIIESQVSSEELYKGYLKDITKQSYEESKRQFHI